MTDVWRRRLAMGFALTCVTAVTLHCASSGSDGGETNGDGDGSDDRGGASAAGGQLATPDGEDEPEVCGISPSQLPPAVSATPSSEEAPTEGLGGPIQPGVYVLTQWIQFSTDTPPENVAERMAAVMVLEENGQGQRIQDWDEESYIHAFEWVTTSDYFGMNFSCPDELAGDSHAEHYTAMGDELIFYTDNQWAEVYTRKAP